MGSLQSNLESIKSYSEKIYPSPDNKLPFYNLAKKGFLDKDNLEHYFKVLRETYHGLNYISPKDAVLSLDLFFLIRNKLRKKYFRYFMRLDDNLRESLRTTRDFIEKLHELSDKESSKLANPVKDILSSFDDSLRYIIPRMLGVRLMKRELYKKIKNDSIKRYKNPKEEACGLLLGRQFSNGLVDIYHYKNVYSAKNIADEPSKNYQIDPLCQIKAYEDAQKLHLNIKAHYHSHPGDAEPSEKDLRFALEHRLSGNDVLIYGVETNKLRAWNLNNQEFVEILISYV